jgi:hypothetical protein
MARAVTSTTTLPDPTHPFARWMGVTVVGLWAVGAQSLPEPISKLIAMLSPGIGYLVGHAIDRFIKWTSARSAEKVQQKELESIEHKINQLRKEKDVALSNGADQSLVDFLDTTINTATRRRIEILSGPYIAEAARPKTAGTEPARPKTEAADPALAAVAPALLRPSKRK